MMKIIVIMEDHLLTADNDGGSQMWDVQIQDLSGGEKPESVTHARLPIDNANLGAILALMVSNDDLPNAASDQLNAMAKHALGDTPRSVWPIP